VTNGGEWRRSLAVVVGVQDAYLLFFFMPSTRLLAGLLAEQDEISLFFFPLSHEEIEIE